MSINKVEQMLQDKLVRKVQENDRNLRAIKNIQPVGADSIDITGFPSAGGALIGPFTIAAGARGTFNVDFNPSASTLTLWNMLWSLYVDAYASANRFPNGASITTEMLNACDLVSWIDYEQSDNVTNKRRFKLYIHNNGASSHDYYLVVQAFLPRIGVS